MEVEGMGTLKKKNQVFPKPQDHRLKKGGSNKKPALLAIG